MDDIQQECRTHGTVVSVIVPRPGEADASSAVGEPLASRSTVLYAPVVWDVVNSIPIALSLVTATPIVHGVSQ